MSDDPFGDLFGEEVEATATVAVAAEEQSAATVEPEAASDEPARPLTGTAPIVFDIETGPRPWEEIECFYQEPAHPGNFDESAVKFGNTKDPAKRREKIEEAREKHAAAVAKWRDGNEDAKAEFLSRAALSPLTGQVLAIGYWQRDFPSVVGVGQKWSLDRLWDERAILEDFWQRFQEAKHTDQKIIGHDIYRFDLPFLVRRSWLLGVDVPGDAIRDNRFWHRCFVDLMQVWGCGIYGERCSLNNVSRYFGEPGKNGDGAEFARLWHGKPEERLQAIAYLKNDLALTAAVAKRMGVI